MEPVSIIIMLLGMAVLAALYFMSRSAKKSLPKEKDMHIHAIRDEEGRMASSVKEDVPGKDTPIDEVEEIQEASSPKAIKETQLILFISADNEAGLNGNKLLNVMEKIGLQYGEMDLFHRLAKTDKGDVSIYTVANGVEPWTLNPDEVRDQNTPGVSLILNLPSSIDDVQAIEDFVNVAGVMAGQLNATLRNQQQQEFTEADKDAMLALVQ